MTITRTDAKSLLLWASAQNPGAWIDHSKTVARAAETVAAACGLDRERAYIYGLLHDIGRYEGWRDLHHVVAGYRLMTERGYGDVARICLTHSFPVKALGAYSGRNFDCSPEELALIEDELAACEFDDYGSPRRCSSYRGRRADGQKQRGASPAPITSRRASPPAGSAT